MDFEDMENVLGNNLVFILLFTFFILLYYYYTDTFDFFEKKGIPFLKPVIFFGNLGRRIRAKKSLYTFQLEIYDIFKGMPLAGSFEGRQPVLYILDPDIIKAITIRDFKHFTDRSSFDTGDPGYLRKNLLNLKGAEWKAVRKAMTPAFTSIRLKDMLRLIKHCADQTVEYFNKYENTEVEMKQTMGRFTLDVIGACAFDIKWDSHNGENEYIYNVAQQLDYVPTYRRIIIFLILIFIPKLMLYFNMSLLNFNSAEKLMKILQVTKAERSNSKSRYNDFLQILINSAKKENSEVDNINSMKYLDEETIDAQCLIFLLAGYETSSTLLSFAIHELAVNSQLQEKLRTHIEEVTDGKEISYELLAELTYLDGFLLEILRLYPPVGQFHRACTKPYTIPNTSVRLNIGDRIAVPVYGIHMDPKYYPEPQECRPERFMDNEKKERASHLFLAFGSGPRTCIGLRFAMISAKTVMVSLIRNYKFSTCSKTVHPIEFDKNSTLLKSEKGLWVRVESL